jgi:hypothetical protein
MLWKVPSGMLLEMYVRTRSLLLPSVAEANTPGRDLQRYEVEERD